jgi:hypothetical protein
LGPRRRGGVIDLDNLEEGDKKQVPDTLKNRLTKEGNETVTNCNALKMQAADGKMRKTDVADTGGDKGAGS